LFSNQRIPCENTTSKDKNECCHLVSQFEYSQDGQTDRRQTQPMQYALPVAALGQSQPGQCPCSQQACPSLARAPGLVKLARKASLPSQDLKAECHSVKRLLEQKSLNLETVTVLLQFLEPYKDAFYQLYKLMQIAVTLPISSAGCKRSFSKLHMIKTYIRNSMADTRLDDLGTITMNRKRAKKLYFEEIVLRFVGKHANRRIVVL